MNGHGQVVLLGRLVARGIGGGRSYGAVIAAWGGQARAEAILTRDGRHVEPPPKGVAVIDPSGFE